MSPFDLDSLAALAVNKARCDGLNPGPAQSGFTALFGPVFTRNTDCYLYVDERHINPEGFVHGGLISAFVDYAFYVSARNQLPNVRACPTIDLHIQYLAAGQLGNRLIGKSTVIRETRHLLFMRCDVFSNDILIAAASGVYKKIR